MRARVWGRPQARRREAPSTCEWGQQITTTDRSQDAPAGRQPAHHGVLLRLRDQRADVRQLPDGSYESFSDDPAGQIISRRDYKGQVTSYTYDPLGRVLRRSYPDGSSVVFTYTPTGQRQTAVDSRGTTSYAYDVRNRLVQLTYPDGRQLAYGYDAHGDRTSLTAKVGATSLTTTTAYDADDRASTVTDPLGRSTA